MVMRERRRWVGISARRAGAVAWASVLLALGCGNVKRERADTTNALPDGGSVECVDVSRVDARQLDSLYVIGDGFQAYEGQMMRILVTHGEPTYGLGEAPIEDGFFDIYLPGVLGDYTGVAFHLDRVRNNACDPDQEILWQETTGPASSRGPLYPTVDGSVVRVVTPETLRVFEQAGPCSLNGIFDLTTPIACTK
jgi:hypothetical protein